MSLLAVFLFNYSSFFNELFLDMWCRKVARHTRLLLSAAWPNWWQLWFVWTKAIRQSRCANVFVVLLSFIQPFTWTARARASTGVSEAYVHREPYEILIRMGKRWQDDSANAFTGVWECLLAFARARGKLCSDVWRWWGCEYLYPASSLSRREH